MGRIGRLGGACVCASVTVLALGASAAGGSARHTDSLPRATGKPAVIAFYRKVVAATRAATADQATFAATDSFAQVRVNPNGSYSWLQLSPREPGFTPARGTFWVVAAAGRVRFVAETLAYGGVGKAFGIFGIVLTARGEILLGGNAFPSVGSARPPSEYQPCGGTTTGTAYVGGYSKVGGPSGYGLYGDFVSMHRAGGAEIVTSTYPWGTKGQRATEVDTVSLATDLPVRSIVHVSAVRGIPAFTFAYTNVWYHTRVLPPNSNGLCATDLRASS
jgi:hypothetical protein